MCHNFVSSADLFTHGTVENHEIHSRRYPMFGLYNLKQNGALNIISKVLAFQEIVNNMFSILYH